MRPRGKYAHPEERKFREQRPEHGQEIGYRRHGCKGYYRGTYDAEDNVIQLPDGTRLSLTYLMGWMPLKKKG